jgi:hypothetical protein
MQVAVRALYPQAVFGQLRGAAGAHQERHITPGLQQPRAKVATRGSHSDNQNSHPRLPDLARQRAGQCAIVVMAWKVCWKRNAGRRMARKDSWRCARVSRAQRHERQVMSVG